MDEYALGINENGEIISDDDEIDDDEDFFSDDDDYFSEEDSVVIRNTRHNAEMRPENCSFINDPIPKARTNKTVQFCEEVGEISDSDYYYEDSDYENEASYYDDEDEEDINPQPQPQMQNKEDMPNKCSNTCISWSTISTNILLFFFFFFFFFFFSTTKNRSHWYEWSKACCS